MKQYKMTRYTLGMILAFAFAGGALLGLGLFALWLAAILRTIQ